MSHSRASDQAIEAFSAPRSLLAQAKARARQLGMFKSGFYRYCLAKELGYSEADARELALHGAVSRAFGATSRRAPALPKYPRQPSPQSTLNDAAPPSSAPPSDEASALILTAEAVVDGQHEERPPKSEAGGPSVQKPGPSPAASKSTTKRRAAGGRAPK